MNSVNQIIKKKPYLAWYIDDIDKLSDEVILEQILNFGDWEDVQAYIKIKGWNDTAKVFTQTKAKQRSNYRPEIMNFFTLYFTKHAPLNS